ncbi:Ish1 domain-containing protein [Acinetobacter nosocomialis]|uniref:Ish1 domain-containing protein n=1 Tax=Acinetobacter TaxID=469 RepID=UPI00124D7D3A|nr:MULTISPECIES: Ish1 domain-containing protein [Acinetobacter]MDA3464698.1 Ish1 domain-containing protein [Acinetobacter sp. AOR41_HL]MDR9576843.1 Ish1 domain-containing protein [Acinetobacter nosocomialis]
MKAKSKKIYFTNDFSVVNVNKLQGEGWVLRNARLAAADTSIEPADEYGGDVPLHYKRSSGTLAKVDVAVGITPELQEVIDNTKAECEKVVEENTQLKQKIEILEQANGDSSELISENSRLKDAVVQAGIATKAAEEQVVSIQAEFEAFKTNVPAMQARIAEIEAGDSVMAQENETATNDYENWSNDQLKEFLASKNIGYKPSATKAELLKLIPKE